MRLRTGNAKMLRPELEQVDGFIDNIRYKSLTREGGILSLSGWRNEKWDRGDYRVQSLNLGRRSSVGSFLRKALASFFAGLSSLALDFPIASVAARNDSDDSSAP
jgi:hypothetical protein